MRRRQHGRAAAGHVYTALHIVHAPADRHQVGTDTVPAHAGAALNQLDIARFVNFQFRVGSAEADAQAVQHPGHQGLNLRQGFFCHVQRRLQMAGLHKEGGAGGKLLGAGQEVVLPLPGDVFNAVFPALGKFLHQGLLLKGVGHGLFHRVAKLAVLRHFENPPAAGAVRGLDDDGIGKPQGLRLLRRADQAAPAGGQAGLFKGQAHPVLVGGGEGAVHAVAGEA